jgi:fumarate hydratase class II
MQSFEAHCLAGIQANVDQLQHYVDNSLVTALTPLFGYDKAAKAAKHAHANNQSLKQAVVDL